MKKTNVFTMLLSIISVSLLAQSGQKWATGGNSNSTGDFLGTTNNFPIDFKTNNVLRMSLGTNGVLRINNLAGIGSRLLQVDANGNIIQLSQGTANQFLAGNGTWQNVPTGIWQASGNNIYWNAGKVGIGTNNPFVELDVIGDARISNNLYVGGGIVITDKVNATTEVKGWDVKVDNDLTVEANARLKGATRIDQGFTFDGINGITKTTVGNTQVLRFGNIAASPLPLSCAAAPTSLFTNQFGGLLQLYDVTNPTGHAVLNMQSFNNQCSIDASVGSQANTAGALLINYFCGNDVSLCQGQYGGFVAMGKNIEMGSPLRDNNVVLNIKSNASQPTSLQIMDANNTVNFKVNTNGLVYSREVIVQLGNFPDYVFKKDYHLTPLNEVEQYIKANNHLKGFEKGTSYEENGMSVGEVVRLQQEKIEELTLYIIELDKKIKELQKNK